MTPKLTDELRRAVQDSPDGVAIPDDQTQQVYVLSNQHWYEKAKEALRQLEDLAAIRAGIEDMDAGRVVPFSETDARIRQKLGLPFRS